jgi:hypothetical protein
MMVLIIHRDISFMILYQCQEEEMNEILIWTLGFQDCLFSIGSQNSSHHTTTSNQRRNEKWSQHSGHTLRNDMSNLAKEALTLYVYVYYTPHIRKS